MARELAERARAAFVDDDFSLSIDLYSQAIESDHGNADLFAERSQARIKIGSFHDAISDANKAIELNPSMAKAYYRKGFACTKIKDYKTAKVVLEQGASLAPNDSRFSKLVDECKKHIKVEDDDIIEIMTPGFLRSGATSATIGQSPDTETEKVEQLQKEHKKAEEVTAVVSAKPKFRHEFYQRQEEIVVTIFAKGVPEKDVTVDYGEQILSVSINKPGEDAYRFQPRLYRKINPGKCKYQVLSTKIEIHLAKAEPFYWRSLEYSGDVATPQPVNIPSVGSSGPAYPSSKGKTINWDKLTAQVKKEEKEEKLDGDAALNKLFRDIYQDANEDTRRAMQKSFLESNGTVLSTNWKEVGSKKVQSTPPDGMELKKWEY
ncbi:hypothetical protein SAY87_015217 [Trapa incisa]|uniref:Protein SGT1 homolog n=1 Tax=Trapa incisa TaxID=236973 RepID=A0AAN7GLB8_9MYRT|nr:hypothetical protein SAY87_015217 [Trapa incisa]